jgi:dTMP kinase
MSTSAPFTANEFDEDLAPANMWAAFRQFGYYRLFLAQVVSSLGDWIGIFAILSIAARVSDSPEVALVLVIVARILPGFFLASIGGMLVDRWDRRRTMIACDLGRASLLLLLPFWNSLIGLIVISLLLEMFTLLWGPAKDASLPYLISPSHLSTANSLGLVAAYGTMPIGSIIFAGLARLSEYIEVESIAGVQIDEEFLALWVDSTTYFISAALIFSLASVFKSIRQSQHQREEAEKAENPSAAAETKKKRIDISKGWKEVVDGYKFIVKHRIVRGVMIGLGIGIIGGGALVPLGTVYALQVLQGGAAAYSLLMTALGTGAAIGIVTLQFVQKNLKRGTVFWVAVVLAGVSMVVTGLSSSLAVSIISVGLFGACAGSAYVTGFTVLQEEVEDSVRGRTFAALYTVIRVCMLVGMTIAPLTATIFEWGTKEVFGTTVATVGSFTYDVPGVRVAIAVGGFVMILGGFISRSQVVHPDKPSKHDEEPLTKGAEKDRPQIEDATVPVKESAS